MTPHPINICNDEGEVVFTFPVSGDQLWLEERYKLIETDKEVLIVETDISPNMKIPGQKKDQFFIVSSMVKSAYPGRKDLLVPKNFIRNNEGRILGCKYLSL